jgi:hypothetical protein
MESKTKKKAATAEATTGTPVLVTTTNKGVFFGYTDDYSGDVITLRRARNCIKWTSDIGGVFGLASRGPSSSCKVTKDPVPSLQLRGITSVSEVSPEAVKAWEASPWG